METISCGITGQARFIWCQCGKKCIHVILLHVFHSHHEEFLSIMTDFFKSIALWSSLLLPVGELKHDLHNLGYSDKETDAIFCNEVLS
jgi:hypothetical protein